MSIRPQEHPSIPAEVSAEAIIAIVSIHDSQASNANRDTPFRKTRLSSQRASGTSRRTNDGCHIFLHRVEGQPCYTLGRGDNKIPGSTNMEVRDVYFPGTQAGLKQFVLIPIWDSDIWRLQSISETIAIINGVPIQASTHRTRKNKNPLPHAIHLKQSTVNHVSINGLKIDIWLLKSVREVYQTKEFDPQPLKYHLQDVAHRSEQWARDRYILSLKQVSANSFRVVERFTGQVQTAKLFRNEQHGPRLRDEEFLMFRKEVDASIVQYHQSVEIESIPAIITSTHDGFVSYAALRVDIKKQHPGVRFSIATKLLRRVFSALEFLHFHGIIHGQVTQESVLLRLKIYEPEAVLLVDYSNATPFTTGARIPLDDMLQDGQAAIQVIEDCCDIWQLRKAATKDVLNEEWMAKKTMTAQKEYQTIQRVVADFERQGGSRTSEKGKKLLRLLEQKNNHWRHCQDEQIHNATRREVGVCRKSNIDEMISDWDRSHSRPKIGEKHFMLLSLGHPWFDQLASQLYHKRWDTTPHEVCVKFKELAGNVEEPWQTFEVKKTLAFVQNDTGYDERCVMAWLAGCCETFQEWRQVLEIECGHHIGPQDGTVTRFDIGNLRDALSRHGCLPQSMVATFDRLMAQDDERRSVGIEEIYHISLHTPSRMFNLTQLQGLASPDRFVLCVNEGRIRCDNYVEVRGEPKLQGCYAPLSLLSAFVHQLDLTLPHDPDQTLLFPVFDPSDFSQVHSGKIVLARAGLIAFATITRTGNQCVFHAPKYPKQFETSNVFLPTYFGDMKVLPQLPEGIYEHARPDHWSKFKTAEDIEDAANVGKRKILQPKGPLKKLTAKPRTPNQASSAALSTAMDINDNALTRMLKQRRYIRSQARPPTKRNTDAQSSNPSTPTAKRSRSSIRPTAPVSSKNVPNITVSFVNRAAERMERIAEDSPAEPVLSVPRIPNSSFFQRNTNVNANLLSSPPHPPVVSDQSFTIAMGSFHLEDDWKQAEEWLKQMPDEEEEEPLMQGIFGFRFHHSHLQDGSETEEETPSGGKSKRTENNMSQEVDESSAPIGNAMPTLKGRMLASSNNFADSLQTFGRNRVATPMATGKSQTPSQSQSFTYGLRSFAASEADTSTPKVKGKAPAPLMSPFNSFPRRSNSQLATPRQSSPAIHSAQPATRGLVQPTHTAILPEIQNGIYHNPDGAIHDWFKDQANAVHGGDDDMPDTDVESWDGDNEEE